MLQEVDSLLLYHLGLQISAGGRSTIDQPSECLQLSRHDLISLWDVPVKWCFIKLFFRETCVRLHVLLLVTQTVVRSWGTLLSQCWSLISFSISWYRCELGASGRKERSGCFFVLAQSQGEIEEHTHCSFPCARTDLWRHLEWHSLAEAVFHSACESSSRAWRFLEEELLHSLLAI